MILGGITFYLTLTLTLPFNIEKSCISSPIFEYTHVYNLSTKNYYPISGCRSAHGVAVDSRSRAVTRMLDPNTLIIELAAAGTPEFTIEDEDDAASGPSSSRARDGASPRLSSRLSAGTGRTSAGAAAGSSDIDLDKFVDKLSQQRASTPDQGERRSLGVH